MTAQGRGRLAHFHAWTGDARQAVEVIKTQCHNYRSHVTVSRPPFDIQARATHLADLRDIATHPIVLRSPAIREMQQEDAWEDLQGLAGVYPGMPRIPVELPELSPAERQTMDMRTILGDANYGPADRVVLDFNWVTVTPDGETTDEEGDDSVTESLSDRREPGDEQDDWDEAGVIDPDVLAGLEPMSDDYDSPLR